MIVDHLESMPSRPEAVFGERRVGANHSNRFGRAVRASCAAYIIVWVLEGAARKWVPGTDFALYFARDALTFTLLGALVLWRTKRGPLRVPLALLVAPALLVAYASLVAVFRQEALAVTAVGVLSYLAPLLLPALAMLNRSVALVQVIVMTLVATTPLEFLVTVVQVASPADSPINLQVGADAAALVTADGVVRASGTFTAPAGLTTWAVVALVGSLVALVAPGLVRSRSLSVLGLLSVIGVIALGGSRGAVLASAIVLAVLLLWLVTRATLRSIVLVIALLVLGGLVVGTAFALLPVVSGAFVERFVSASGQEDSGARILDQAIGYLHSPPGVLGDGAGTHSTVGISLGAAGPWQEIDADRWVSELGLVGYVLACVRLCFAAWVVLRTARAGSGSAVAGLAIITAAALVPILAWGSITTNPSTQAGAGILLGLFCLSVSSALATAEPFVRNQEVEELKPRSTSASLAR